MRPSDGSSGTRWILPLILALLLTSGVDVEPAPTGEPMSLLERQEVPGQWVMPAKRYSGIRFSKLDRINAFNVDGLEPAWTFSSGINRGHEGSPFVVGNTLYLTTPDPNRVFALDLTRPGAPVKWQFTPDQESRAVGVAWTGGPRIAGAAHPPPRSC